MKGKGKGRESRRDGKMKLTAAVRRRIDGARLLVSAQWGTPEGAGEEPIGGRARRKDETDGRFFRRSSASNSGRCTGSLRLFHTLKRCGAPWDGCASVVAKRESHRRAPSPEKPTMGRLQWPQGPPQLFPDHSINAIAITVSPYPLSHKNHTATPIPRAHTAQVILSKK